MGWKIIVVILILWALSFVMLEDIPNWIKGDQYFHQIIFITVNVLFSFAFIKYGFKGG